MAIGSYDLEIILVLNVENLSDDQGSDCAEIDL